MENNSEDLNKNIENIMYELRTLTGIIFLSFFFNLVTYIILFGYFLIVYT